MAWARLDDGFHDHPKVFALPLEAVGLFTLSLTWAHRHKATYGVLGYLPVELPLRFAGNKAKRLTDLLVSARLWDVEVNLGGWVIHDFIDYLPAADRPQTADEVRAARSEAGKRGAKARWGDKANPSQTDGKLLAVPDGKPMPPSRPDPTQAKDASNDASGASRATRLSDDFAIDIPMTEWWIQQGYTAEFVGRSTDKFRDYWRAVPGAKGRKTDWPATWRNWLRTEADRVPSSRASPRPSTTDQRVADGQALVAHFRALEST